MKTYAWLVKYIENSGESGAYLGCQADSLRFAAGERNGASAQRQVFQTDVHEKLQTCPQLFHNSACNCLLTWSQLYAVEEGLYFVDWHI